MKPLALSSHAWTRASLMVATLMSLPHTRPMWLWASLVVGPMSLPHTRRVSSLAYLVVTLLPLPATRPMWL